MIPASSATSDDSMTAAISSPLGPRTGPNRSFIMTDVKATIPAKQSMFHLTRNKKLTICFLLKAGHASESFLLSYDAPTCTNIYKTLQGTRHQRLTSFFYDVRINVAY